MKQATHDSPLLPFLCGSKQCLMIYHPTFSSPYHQCYIFFCVAFPFKERIISLHIFLSFVSVYIFYDPYLCLFSYPYLLYAIFLQDIDDHVSPLLLIGFSSKQLLTLCHPRCLCFAIHILLL